MLPWEIMIQPKSEQPDHSCQPLYSIAKIMAKPSICCSICLGLNQTHSKLFVVCTVGWTLLLIGLVYLHLSYFNFVLQLLSYNEKCGIISSYVKLKYKVKLWKSKQSCQVKLRIQTDYIAIWWLNTNPFNTYIIFADMTGYATWT